MSDSVQRHRRQPTRLPCPWDSPGKNTGVGCLFLLQCMKMKSESEVTLSCPTLRDPMECSLPGFSVHGIFQATVLEWDAITFSNISLIWNLKNSINKLIYKTETDSQAQKTNMVTKGVPFSSVQSLSRVWLFATPQIAADQAPLSMGFFRQEHWSGVPLPSPRCRVPSLFISKIDISIFPNGYSIFLIYVNVCIPSPLDHENRDSVHWSLMHC